MCSRTKMGKLSVGREGVIDDTRGEGGLGMSEL